MNPRLFKLSGRKRKAIELVSCSFMVDQIIFHLFPRMVMHSGIQSPIYHHSLFFGHYITNDKNLRMSVGYLLCLFFIAFRLRKQMQTKHASMSVTITREKMIMRVLAAFFSCPAPSEISKYSCAFGYIIWVFG